MKAYEAVKLGEHRGSPRLWLQGMKAKIAGFLPGMRFNVRKDPEKFMLVLELSEHGDRVVSRKLQGEKVIPIIDINSHETLSMFEGFDSLRITIEEGGITLQPMAVEIAKKERLARLKAKLQAGEPLSVGSLAHGGGVLSHALHRGLADGGVAARLAFANDIRADLLEHAHEHNSAWDAGTMPLAAPMQALAFDEAAMSRLPKVELVEAGSPCTAYSLSGRARRGGGHPESHPDVGHLVVALINIIAKVQPAAVLFENVKPFSTTASMCILRTSLREFGYEVHETVLKGNDFNELEARARLCMVAVTEGLDIDLAQITMPEPVARTISEALDPVAADDPSWDEMAYLKRKQESDAEKGRLGRKGTNFKMQILTPENPACPVIGTSYYKRRSTEPKLAHPTNPALLRQFTVAEHCRMKGAPLDLVEGLGVTMGHQLLGQSICYGPFRAVGRLIADSLQAFKAGAAIAKRPRVEQAQGDLFSYDLGVPA
ncbi:DNA cytosine methyltransferase [Acidovorax sp. sic0104]|uniref:DNA cytosine methyltransferase n=1 Tax=Acidovorax sp. sic0104 TaxID=2854784 RepID=UPI001C44B440|nr:DNA cytosine methyltransferase [Acidovorax sp. sic0104]MBV7541933.1 DNA cytosine methyltransferase [Acidovorax sp. sic0104]